MTADVGWVSAADHMAQHVAQSNLGLDLVKGLFTLTRDDGRRGRGDKTNETPISHMKVLIVESNLDRGLLWKRYIEGQGAIVTQASSQQDAIIALCGGDFDVIVLDVVLDDGSALAVADFASYRRPEARVIFVTDTSVFSDGSIFAHATNACAFVQSGAPPEDLVAMVEHHASVGRSLRPLWTEDPARAAGHNPAQG